MTNDSIRHYSQKATKTINTHKAHYWDQDNMSNGILGNALMIDRSISDTDAS